jgi:hypothetical protein
MTAFDPQMELLSTLLADVGRSASWSDARAALAACGDVEDAELVTAVQRQDETALRAILDGWSSDKRLLTVHDREVLKRALKAYRKSLKVTLLDAESSLGVGPFSGGRKSGIVGITPPARYPRAVWDELVRQKRLVHSGQGVYELPPEA